MDVVFISSTTYVNGQRQGTILEKPFSIGDSLAREQLTSNTHARAPPLIDIEAEMKLDLHSKETFQENLNWVLKGRGPKVGKTHMCSLRPWEK
ncbi:hypothetical protein C5167_047124 [Papaver somniferum]|uniref:Uncharacterized protein n=1 Tax=Papaver somniferum TaxID=3469 RepID=A0A4Y7LJI8_PAPSO|nr:hypothetical protein C5167_047124 [Papaver somniferum]